MAKKILKGLGLTLLVVLAMMGLFIVTNLFHAKKLPAVAEIDAQEKAAWDQVKNHPVELISFILEKRAEERTPEELRQYAEILKKQAVVNYTQLPFEHITVNTRHLNHHWEYLKLIAKDADEKRLDYLLTTLKFSDSSVRKKSTLLGMMIELSLIASYANYVDKNFVHKNLSLRSNRMIQEIKDILAKIVIDRENIFANVIAGQRNLNILYAGNSRMFELLADTTDSSLLTRLLLLGYDENATQNAAFTNAEELFPLVGCLKDHTCDSLCKDHECSEYNTTKDVAGNVLKNPIGAHYIDLMSFRTDDFSIFKKASKRFQGIERTITSWKRF